jgi:hypothetical protein
MRLSPFARIGRRAAVATGALLLATAVAASPFAAAVPVTGTLYVTENGTGSVLSLPATGGSPTVLAAGLDEPFSVTTAASNCTGSLCIPFGS